MRSSILFLAFLAYSFMGWLYESTVWAVCEKKRFINRGYLIGPYCPIYGFVSLFDWYLLYETDNPLKLFIMAAVICCSLEYITSVLLEKLFHTRWWDYSNYPFNLNGRISLFSAVLFGFAGLVLIKIVYPYVFTHLALIPEPWLSRTADLLFLVFVSDCAVSTIGIAHLNPRVEQMYDRLSYCAALPFDYLTEYTGRILRDGHKGGRDGV
jgi:uncharacterized membrane protein